MCILAVNFYQRKRPLSIFWHTFNDFLNMPKENITRKWLLYIKLHKGDFNRSYVMV